MATYKWVAHKLLKKIRLNNDIPISKCNDELNSLYGITLKKSSAYVMRQYALKLIHGQHDQSYSKLPAYCEVLKVANPGSVAHCAWVEGEYGEEEEGIEAPERPLVFKYIFVALDASVKGFISGCRRLIGVDGAHLKGSYGCVLISAIAIDGNNEIFPIAHAIVDSENKESWSTFIWHLKQLLEESNKIDWTIISDRQKGIMPALEEVWPTVSKRFCARHMARNFKRLYPGPLMNFLFWSVVHAYSEFVFRKAMSKLKNQGGLGAEQWLKDVGDHELWARYKIEVGTCQDQVTTNFVESFNATLGSDRCKPVLTLLQGIRRVSMVRHGKRQQIAQHWNDDGICPKIEARVTKITNDARTCRVYTSGIGGKFEVQDGQSYRPVNIEAKTCVCGR